MRKRLNKLITLFMVAVALSWVVQQGVIDALAENVSGYGDLTISSDSSDSYVFGSGAQVLTVDSGVTLSGNVNMSGDTSNTLINKGTITGVISNAAYSNVFIENYGTIQTALTLSGGAALKNYAALGSVSLSGTGTTFNMYSGTAANLTSDADSTVNLNGGTIDSISATGSVNINDTTTIKAGTVSSFLGAGTVNITDSITFAASGTTATVNVGRDTKITSQSAVVVHCDGKDITVSDAVETTPRAELGKKVTFDVAESGHMTTTDSLPADKYWFGEDTGTVTYTAAPGYCFPMDYEDSVFCDGGGTLHIVRTSAQTIGVSYTLGADEADDVTVTLPATSPKGTQNVPADLTGGINEVIGTTSEMEYASSSDAADTDWTACSDEITEIATPGMWYIRYKDNGVQYASQSVAVQVLTKGNGTITVNDICYGKTPSPVVTSDTNGTAYVTIEYKQKDSADSTYTTTVPKAVGDYTARATFAQQGLYALVTATDDFTISYLAVPNTPYTITATQGENGFYRSAVTVTAASGYLISEKLDGTYVSALVYDESKDVSNLYLMKADTGEKSGAITVPEFKIDSVTPRTNAVDGRTYYGDKKELEFSDENLKKITVNGEEIEITGNVMNLELTSNGGVEEYIIIVIDQAGNTSKVTLTVAAEWTRSGIIPSGETVRLTTANAYKLGSGIWQVGGDSTSYNGNQTFYVGRDGEYSFTGK